MGTLSTGYSQSDRSFENKHESTQNQRQSERFKTVQSVYWHHHHYKNKPGKIRDISSSGIFLMPEGVSPEKIQYDDFISIVLCINEKEYVFSTRVRWVGESRVHNTFGIGLEFDQHSRDDRWCL